MKGVNGVVVAVAAIVATVLIGGTVGALNSVTVETTDYDYVTNINSLYDLEEQPVPSEYSPAGNWNGWKLSSGATVTGGISYTTLDRYNGVPVLVNPTTTTLSGTIPTTLTKPNPPYNPNATTNIYHFSDTSDPSMTHVYNAVLSQAVKLSDWLVWFEANNDLASDYEMLTLNTTDLGIVVIDDITTETRYYMNGDIITTSTNSASWPKSIEINRNNGSVALMNATGQIYQSEMAENLLLIFSLGDDRLSDSYTVTSVAVEDPIYIDTAKGITVTSDPAYWTNGYDVAKIRFVFQTNVANCKTTFSAPLYDAATGSQLSLAGYGTITMTLQAWTDNDKDITLYLRMVGNTGQDPASAVFNLGRWPGAVIDIDLYSGTATAAGIRNFGDFRDYETSGAEMTKQLEHINGASIEGMRAWNDGTGLTFGIDQTSVYLTATETVMVDPSITIGNHFPDMADSFQARYDSFVKWGNTITINGTEYAVQNKMLKDVPYLNNGEVTYYDVDLTNLRVTVNNDQLTMQYSDGRSYTAALQDPTITFGGLWYFDSDLYSVVTGTTTEYDYTGGYNLDWSGSIVVYLITLAAGSLAITKFRNPGILDWLIVAFAAAAGWVML